MRYFITGDIHGQFAPLFNFNQKESPSKDDILIILGDGGFNYYGDSRDRKLKEKCKNDLPFTIFTIHGNHEMNPEYMDTCMEKEWNGGIVFYEEAYPNLLYAKDGEIYHIGDKDICILGGAYSVDKEYRLLRGWHWFSDEQMSDDVKQRCLDNLEKHNWKVDYVFSHTVPFSCEPVEFFLPYIDQSTVDKSTELFLEDIKQRLTYEKWFAGHYHCDIEKPDNVFIMYKEVIPLIVEKDIERNLIE